MPPSIAEATICRECGCDRVAEIRGLCSGHYAKYKYRVQNGLTDWKKLEAEGIVLKRKSVSLNLALGAYQVAEKSDLMVKYGGDKAAVEKHLLALRAKYIAEGVING